MPTIHATSGPVFWVIVGLVVLAFLIAEALLVASALHPPTRASVGGEGAAGQRRRERASEVIWTLLPALLLLALLIASFHALRQGG